MLSDLPRPECPAQAACSEGARPYELIARVHCALVTPLRRWQVAPPRGLQQFAWSGNVYAHQPSHRSADGCLTIAARLGSLELVRFGNQTWHGPAAGYANDPERIAA